MATDVIAPCLLTGAQAVVEAMRQIDPDVVPVYPITLQTPMIEGFAKVVADGRARTEIVDVESEHSAMSAAVASALAGARTFTATSSQGMALMAEVVYIAAGMRAPVVMAVGNRALSAPINIHGDHSDSMLVRDSGAGAVMARLKRLVVREGGRPPLRGGHSLCQGCGIPTIVRTVLDTIPGSAVVVSATGCLEVATTRYPPRPGRSPGCTSPSRTQRPR